MDLKVHSAIKKQAESCKVQLSRDNTAHMDYTIGENKYNLTISSDEFEEITQELLIRLRQPLQKALRDSEINSSDLDDIILVGGSTKMPVIRSFVSKLFRRLPLSSLNPDEVVALGAGIYAAMKERNENLRETVLTDVCPYTLGTEVMIEDEYGKLVGGHFLPIIERNTTIPFSKVKRLYTAYDNQTVLSIEVYQGESRLVANNLRLGEIMINVPPAPRGQSAIDVRYTYDINGILEVEVTSLKTGEKKIEVIISNNSMTKDEAEKRLKELSEIKIHPRDNTRNRYLLAKAERLYEESLSDLRLGIASWIQHFEAVLDRQNPSEIRAEVKRFEEFLSGIESRGI